MIRYIIGAVVFAAYTAAVAVWADTHLSSAQALAEYDTKQKALDSALTEQLQADKVQHATEAAEWAQQKESFKAALEVMKDCPMDADDRAAFNNLIGAN